MALLSSERRSAAVSPAARPRLARPWRLFAGGRGAPAGAPPEEGAARGAASARCRCRAASTSPPASAPRASRQVRASACRGGVGGSVHRARRVPSWQVHSLTAAAGCRSTRSAAASSSASGRATARALGDRRPPRLDVYALSKYDSRASSARAPRCATPSRSANACQRRRRPSPLGARRGGRRTRRLLAEIAPGGRARASRGPRRRQGAPRLSAAAPPPAEGRRRGAARVGATQWRASTFETVLKSLRARRRASRCR